MPCKAVSGTRGRPHRSLGMLGSEAGLEPLWGLNRRWNAGPGEKRKSLLSSGPFNLGSPKSASGVLPGSPGRQPPPRRPGADSGRQGPFASAGGSPTNSPPQEELMPWGSAFRPGLKCPETSPGLGGVTGRHSWPEGQAAWAPWEEEKGPLGTGPGWPPQTPVSPQWSARAPSLGFYLSSATSSHPRGAPAASTYGDSSGICPLFLSQPVPLSLNLTTVLAPGSTRQFFKDPGLRVGAIPQQRRGKHTRLEKGTRATSNFHSAGPAAEPVRQ